MDLGEKMTVKRERECESKRRYGSEAGAVRSARNQTGWTAESFRLRAYYCIWCRGWHLTSK